MTSQEPKASPIATDDVRIRRALRQRLEDLRRAGLTHLAWAPERHGAAQEKAPPLTAAEPPAQDGMTGGTVSRKGAEKTDPARQLTALARTVSECTRCPELAATRTQTVFGVGNPCAEIVFVGEASGADEDRQGEPFVGAAGQLLDKIIAACRLTREEIYICNILKC
ncbi:MAG TPA: uracil-DNA glycosylase, partial [Planctomycetaceae bacterium]|nr:uracil-DNA glycosylase [Planctomycetaceae bacterium]